MPQGPHGRDRAIIQQMVHDTKHSNLPPQGPPEHVITLAPGVCIRFHKAQWVCMSLLIDETTSLDKVTACWDAIRAWKDQLALWQGATSMAGQYVANLARWHGAWRQGKHAKPSAADLASWVNNEVAGAMQDFVTVAHHARQGIDDKAVSALLAVPAARAPEDHWAWGLYYAATILDIMGLSSADIHVFCEYAIKNLMSHRSPVLPDYPVTREHVTTRLKTYRRRQYPPS